MYSSRHPVSPVPLRAGGNEVLLYFFAFLYLAAVGGGIWNIDFMIQKWRATAPALQLNRAVYDAACHLHPPRFR
jgi:hypothetical protein